MASSSTTSINKSSFKYDVFLSFRGEDTRTNFVDHLYHAFKRQNIETYKDDKNLEKGNKISKELIQAIEESRFHVVVFSKNYASSSWCLEELVKITECQKMQTGQTVYPIFYDVEPTQVRKQSGEFGKAFAKHENDEAAKKWREALVEATSFSGRNLSTTADGHEVEFIKLVVNDISSKLPAVGADENLVGMRTRINGVVSSLNAFPDEFCMIGITGMGGIGKTTLAKAVFDQIRNEFEGISFVENVREVSNSLLLGLKSLQQQILRDVLNTQDITVTGVLEGKTMMKRKIPGRKVLVVLDDVDHIDQLKALAGESNWFKPGSKIIITTRDKQVLLAHKVNSIYDVNMLTDDEAICLLSRCAFGTEIPISGHKELSGQVVSYAAGLPLTITILGSTLYGEDRHVWEDTLEELKKIPLDGTLQRLELSYKGLDTNCKELFLDVACILTGWKEDEAIKVLESCGFPARRGLSVLKKRSLITISERDRCLYMHDSIKEMGRYIVRRSNLDEPGRHSRLWIDEEIKDILANNRGTKATTCLHLIMGKINPETVMKGLGKMEKLRLLYVFYIDDIYSDWVLDEVSQNLPNSLQYLNWYCYPFCSLPKTFQASNLVALEMSNSKIEQLWEGEDRKVLHKLRFLHLNFSRLRILDLRLTPNLEILDLEYCYDLVELDMRVGCPKLKSLKLNSSNLSTFDLRFVPNIETLDLENCDDLVELDMPWECPQLKSLNLSSPKLRSLNLSQTPNIETLNLKRCDNLVELDIPRECPQLKSLNLSCLNLRSLNRGPTPNIKTLKLEECDYMVEVDVSLECPQLESLNLEISRLRTLDLGPTPNLETLELHGCYNLVELRMHEECCKLKTLCLRCPQLRTFDFGLTLNLEALTLDGHDDLVELFISVGCPELEYLRLINSKLRALELTLNLKKLILESCDFVDLHIPDENVMLESLDIKRCLELRTLELTLNLKKLILESCDLEELNIPDGDVMLESLDIKRCLELRTLELTLNLKKLILESCGLIELHIPDGDVKLESLDIIGCSELKTLDLRRTPNLERLRLKECSSLVKLHVPVGGLKKLINLKAQGFLRFTEFTIMNSPGLVPELDLHGKLIDICPLHPDNNFPKFQFNFRYMEDLPSSLGNIEKLISEGFSCACTDLQSYFGSICGLQHLRKLTLQGSIPEAPKDLDRLQCLEELTFSFTRIRYLPDSICMLKHLKSLKLYDCELLEKLPEDLGRLECLEKLVLKGCKVLRDIPNSICRMKSLKYFSLLYCTRVEELPEELGHLECLEELDIRGTCLNNLPSSILLLEGLRIVRAEDETPTTTSTGGC